MFTQASPNSGRLGAYQYGSQEVIYDPPKFWNQATSQNWSGMNLNFMAFGDKTPLRRKQEAKVIKELIK